MSGKSGPKGLSFAAFATQGSTTNAAGTNFANPDRKPAASGFGGALRQALAQEVSREQTARQNTLQSLVKKIVRFVESRREEVTAKVRQLCQQRHVVTFLSQDDLRLGQRPVIPKPSIGSLSLVDVGKLAVSVAEESVLSECRTTVEERVSRRLDLEVTLELLSETSRNPEGQIVLYYQVFVAV